MASTGKTGISGIGLAIVAAGAVLIYSGVQNRKLMESLRYLAMGKAIPPGEQISSPVNYTGTGAVVPAGLSGGNNAIVNMAASYKGRTYTFGGGHRSFCPSGGLDCSGYVSCVLHRLGLLNGGPLTTDGFAKWGSSVPFANRQPGDIVVWNGGPGGGHMGIVINATTMWHNPCTGCGGVQIGKYGPTRSGRVTIVRRASGASGAKRPATISV